MSPTVLLWHEYVCSDHSVYLQMAKGSGESFNEPWPVFAKALSKHPLAKVDVIVEQKVRRFKPNLGGIVLV